MANCDDLILKQLYDKWKESISDLSKDDAVKKFSQDFSLKSLGVNMANMAINYLSEVSKNIAGSFVQLGAEAAVAGVAQGTALAGAVFSMLTTLLSLFTPGVLYVLGAGSVLSWFDAPGQLRLLMDMLKEIDRIYREVLYFLKRYLATKQDPEFAFLFRLIKEAYDSINEAIELLAPDRSKTDFDLAMQESTFARSRLKEVVSRAFNVPYDLLERFDPKGPQFVEHMWKEYQEKVEEYWKDYQRRWKRAYDEMKTKLKDPSTYMPPEFKDIGNHARRIGEISEEMNYKLAALIAALVPLQAFNKLMANWDSEVWKVVRYGARLNLKGAEAILRPVGRFETPSEAQIISSNSFNLSYHLSFVNKGWLGLLALSAYPLVTFAKTAEGITQMDYFLLYVYNVSPAIKILENLSRFLLYELPKMFVNLGRILGSPPEKIARTINEIEADLKSFVDLRNDLQQQYNLMMSIIQAKDSILNVFITYSVNPKYKTTEEFEKVMVWIVRSLAIAALAAGIGQEISDLASCLKSKKASSNPEDRIKAAQASQTQAEASVNEIEANLSDKLKNNAQNKNFG